MVSRKSRVSAMSILLLAFRFPAFDPCLCLGLLQSILLEFLVFSPGSFGILYILVLPFLCTAAKQDDELIAVFAEINPVAWTEIDLVFRDAFTNRLNRGRIASGNTFQRDGDFGCGCNIEAVKPRPVFVTTTSVQVLTNPNHLHSNNNTYVINVN